MGGELKEAAMSVCAPPSAAGGIDDLLFRVRAEFLEMPGLHLTEAQARRLWGLDPPTCDRLLTALVATQFLRRAANGAFARAELTRIGA
jgi:hypothetical protein